MEHSNKYNAENACPDCGGVVRHESWCRLACPDVAYAYSIVSDPRLINVEDEIMLHALGVVWHQKNKCKKLASSCE